MLRSASSIHGYTLAATDAELGSVRDFLLDDRTWAVRYLAADTSFWLPGRTVILAPSAVEDPDWKHHRLPVRLSKEQVQNAPELAEDRPVSMQHEVALHEYYGWVRYWGARSPVMMPEIVTDTPAGGSEKPDEQEGDPHLRSAREIQGYNLEAHDGEIGHVDDFILDTEEWLVRYAVVKTRNWLPGRKVLVAPAWLFGVKWSDRKVDCLLTREEIRNSPEYDPRAPVNREYEEQLYDYYGRPKYWTTV